MEDSNNKSKGISLDMFRTDPTLSQEGAWITYMQGTRFLIAQAGNKKAAAYRNKLFQENAYAIQQKDMGVIIEIGIKVMAKHILLGWENLHDLNDAGEEVEVVYSEDVAYQKLTDLPKLSELVTNWSEDLSNFKNSGKSETAKNS